MSRARIYKEGRETVQPNSNARELAAEACGPTSWVGIDVSQDWVDVVVLVAERKAEQFRCDRAAAALGELARRLLTYEPRGVVLEATGGLEGAVITALVAAGLKVMRMNPKRVRDFARAHGLLAKTDALDAHILALFGARMQPALRPWPEAERQQLAGVAVVEELLLHPRLSPRPIETFSDPLRRALLVHRTGAPLQNSERLHHLRQRSGRQVISTGLDRRRLEGRRFVAHLRSLSVTTARL